MRSCPLCRARFANFLPLPPSFFDVFHRLRVFYSLEDFETLNVGQYSCPNCQSSDRDRLYALFTEQHLKRAGQGPLRILDIAPAPVLSGFLKQLPNSVYRSADLFSALADDKVDLQDMSLYPDAAFDFIVCSHVLEHVPDDRQAMAELYRVLAPGGVAILMVPILTTATETDEDPAEVSVDERWARFGQDDHVRMYCRDDFLARLGVAGFAMHSLASADFAPGSFTRHGITERSVLYVGRK
jgi:SAM-dependent methyltransferase